MDGKALTKDQEAGGVGINRGQVIEGGANAIACTLSSILITSISWQPFSVKCIGAAGFVFHRKALEGVGSWFSQLNKVASS